LPPVWLNGEAMEVIRSIDEIRDLSGRLKCDKVRLALIPTMGALHEGHLTLLSEAKQRGLYAIATIFVNPTQFNDSSDLAAYPRQEDLDIKLLKTRGCDAVFVPEESEIYPEEVITSLSFGILESHMEGSFRPGHFRGVGIIMTKLLNIIRVDYLFMGQKDLQQAMIIKRLINDFSFPVELIICPTEREANGLAMSSRNSRLSARGFEQAAAISKTIFMGRDALLKGKSVSETKEGMLAFIHSMEGIEVEYLEIINTEKLTPISYLPEREQVSICISAYVDGVRLIDNVYLREYVG